MGSHRQLDSRIGHETHENEMEMMNISGEASR